MLSTVPEEEVMWLLGIQTLPPERAEVPPRKEVFSMRRGCSPWWWARRQARSPAAPAPIMRMSQVSGGVGSILRGVFGGGTVVLIGCGGEL